jgi:HAD superfamily hydrolase (TIGR01509 family)
MTPSSHVPHAIIFDMDGLLVHTEPFWVQAQIEILTALGAIISEHTCAQTKGLRIDEVVQHYHNQNPLQGASVADTATQIAKRVSVLFREKGALLPGVHHALKTARKLNVPIALSSSSPYFLINDLLTHSNIGSLFDLIVSAEDDPFGKPHPAIYIRTAQMLGCLPQNCIALEDSFFGLLAAKSARMRCIIVPEFDHPQWVIADHSLSSLSDLRPAHFSFI